MNFFSRVKRAFQFLGALPAFCRLYAKRGLPIAGLWNVSRRFRHSYYGHALEVDEFFRYRLWRTELGPDQWTAFIGWRKHIQALTGLNPIPYRCLTENKMIFYQRCVAANLPTPKVYAVVDPTRSNNTTIPSLRSPEELLSFLEKETITEFVLKPVHGTRGQSVRILYFDPSTGLSLADGGHISVEELKELTEYRYRDVQQNSFLVQERIHPHAVTQDLNPNCPLSYRAITLLNEIGEPSIVHVYAKLPSGGSFTDNLHANGLACVIDDNGAGVGARSYDDFTQLVERDPIRGFEIRGWKVPSYKEVCDLALRLAIEFHPVRCIAWDIAVSRQGVMVYEGNNPWNMDVQDVHDQGLWRGEFARQGAAAIRDGPGTPPWWS